MIGMGIPISHKRMDRMIRSVGFAQAEGPLATMHVHVPNAGRPIEMPRTPPIEQGACHVLRL